VRAGIKTYNQLPANLNSKNSIEGPGLTNQTTLHSIPHCWICFGLKGVDGRCSSLFLACCLGRGRPITNKPIKED